MASKIILPNTSLCSIVRDEKMNPAGGIQRFVEAHVPFVEEAVIVDTGSLDGTREILEEMQAKYSNLRIYDHYFKGFADARNYSLSKVKTKYSLVLDADELLCQENPQNDWEKINNYMQENKDFKFLEFDIEDVSLKRKIFASNSSDYWKMRLFQPSQTELEGALWENHINFEKFHVDKIKGVSIKHFLPKLKGIVSKQNYWYKERYEHLFIEEIVKNGIAPSQIAGFIDWKKYNPKRDLYY